jgi:hypothetical protein
VLELTILRDDLDAESIGFAMVVAMRRNLIVTTLLVVGCTRPNPAFDEYLDGTSETLDGVGDGDSGEVGEGGTEVGESGGGEGDLPDDSVCEYQPSDGLDLRFGDPEYFGGTCPNSVDIWARIPGSGGGPSSVETCSPGCDQCNGVLPISIEPLSLVDYVPTEEMNCLRIQANGPLGGEPGLCEWATLSLHDGWDDTPYFIAITHGSEPTPMGFATVSGLIPEPIEVASCSCDAVGQSNECCYEADSPPEFLAYPWDDELLLPGDSAPITIPNQAGADHDFEVFQAERLNACESSGRSLSWAVLADLP